MLPLLVVGVVEQMMMQQWLVEEELAINVDCCVILLAERSRGKWKLYDCNVGRYTYTCQPIMILPDKCFCLQRSVLILLQ